LTIRSYFRTGLLWQQTAVAGAGGLITQSSTPALAINSAGNAVVAGSFSSTASFGSIQLSTPPTEEKTFLAEVGLQGGAGAVTLSNPSWAFSPRPIGTSSSLGRIYVTNSGTAPLNVLNVAVGDGTAGGAKSFSATTGCPMPLGVQHTCSIDIVFTPAQAGDITASIQLITDSPGSPLSISVSGRGLGPQILLSNTTWGFQAHPVGQASGPGTVFVTNTGQATLHFVRIGMGGTEPNDFPILSTTCGATLAPGATCSVRFEFKPTSTGTRTGSLIFADDVPGSPQRMSLSGQGL
jgi:hypothetical protein